MRTKYYLDISTRLTFVLPWDTHFLGTVCTVNTPVDRLSSPNGGTIVIPGVDTVAKRTVNLHREVHMNAKHYSLLFRAR